MNLVKVIYNPFLPELKISVNGSRISPYSALMSCKNHRAESWCGSFFKDLYREINSEYEVEFYSTDFICGVFEVLAKNERHCLSFTSKPLPIGRSVLDRLSDPVISRGINTKTSYIPIINASSEESMISAFCEILQDQGVAEYTSDESVRISFPYAETELCPVDDLPCSADCSCAIALCESEDSEIDFSGDVPVYAFVFGTETAFIGKDGNCLFFSVDPDSVGDLLLDIIKEEILCPFLSSASYELLSRSGDRLTEHDKDELLMICAASPICIVSIPAVCSVGRSETLTAKILPKDSDEDWYAVSDDPGVISAEGKTIYPKRDGSAGLTVYLGDDPYPAAAETVRVYNRRLVSSISVFPSVLYLPKNGDGSVKLTVSPENADNINEIVFESSDPGIARPDEYGRITGISCGKCVVTAKTREASCSFSVEVQPEIESIKFPGAFLELYVGDRKEWRYKIEPPDGYGFEMMRITSSDKTVAEYSGGYVTAKSAGSCRIIVSDPSGAASCELRVTVKKRGLFR